MEYIIWAFFVFLLGYAYNELYLRIEELDRNLKNSIQDLNELKHKMGYYDDEH